LIQSLIVGRNFDLCTRKRVLEKLRALNIDEGMKIELPTDSELARVINRDIPGQSKDLFGALIKMFEYRRRELVFVVDNSVKMNGS
jgi:hypothetical protein